MLIFFLAYTSLASLVCAVEIPEEAFIEFKKNISKDDSKSYVKEIKLKDGEYYIIGTSSEKFEGENEYETKEELSLLNKHALVMYLRKQKKVNNGRFKFKMFIDYKFSGDEVYNMLVSLIKKTNVAPERKRQSNKNKMVYKETKQEKHGTSLIYSGSIDKDVSELTSNLEKNIVSNKDVLKSYKKLYTIYFSNGDIGKTSELMDKIIEYKFNKF